MLLKKEVNKLNDEIDILKNRNLFLQEIGDDLNMKLIAYERQIEHREQTLIVIIRAEHKRFQIVQENLTELRSRFSGCVPLQSIQRHQAALEEMSHSQAELSQQMEEIKAERNELRAKIQEFQVKNMTIQEMMNLSSSNREEKVVKWQQAAEKAKLNEVQLRRHIGQLENENIFLKNQLTKKVSEIKSLGTELDSINEKSLSVDILCAQHETIVDELKKNLEGDALIRAESRAQVLAENPHLSVNLDERCQQLQMDSVGLRSNLSAISKQYDQLREEFNANRKTLFEKDRQIVEKEQIIGEYKLKLRELGGRLNAEDNAVLSEKQKTVSNAIGFADVTAKMVLLEQRASNAEAKLSTKVKELEIRGKTIWLNSCLTNFW